MSHANQMRLLRSMRAGDQVYLAEDPSLSVPLARQLHSLAAKYQGKLKTKYFLATDTMPETAHRIVRVTMVHQFKSLGRGKRGRPRGRAPTRQGHRFRHLSTWRT